MNAVVVADFAIFKSAVAKRFAEMQKYPLFRVDLTKDNMWAKYLGSFPEGTNPVYRKRTEYDCSCCRHFIRDVGNVVAVRPDGTLMSIWAQPTFEPTFDIVSMAMDELVRSRPIDHPFMHYEREAGTDKNYEGRGTDKVRVWNHFHVTIAPAFVGKKDAIPSILGKKRAGHDVLARSLNELTLDAIDTVLDLIGQGSLYRGDDHKSLVLKFRELHVQHAALPDDKRDIFVWTVCMKESDALTHIRNTAIGTLLVNLSEGMELEAAVKAFETVMAPQNYKRPTALVTPKMVEQAKATIESLGLTSALERRFAVLSDVNINDIVWGDKIARRALGADVFDEIKATTKKPDMTTVEEVAIDRFIAEILPRAESIEVLLENKLAPNLVSLIAPKHKDASLLFKWPNPYSWSYAGEFADSIKERVKKAGGNVDGDLSCRLAWNNTDDLDFHMIEPDGHRIYYGNRRHISHNGGMLDVDANGADGIRRDPVENIFYANRSKMSEGIYELKLHMYGSRESADKGYEIEIDWMGTVYSVASDKSPRQREMITIARMKYTKRDGIKMLSDLKETRASKPMWSISSETYHRVSVVMLSPNYWDGAATGNKHYFFMIDGCANDGTARGFFNEFLTPALDAHRKVFEIVGSKMKPAPASEQLSGLGFSSTQRNSLICRVKGRFNRTIKITF